MAVRSRESGSGGRRAGDGGFRQAEMRSVGSMEVGLDEGFDVEEETHCQLFSLSIWVWHGES